MVDIAKIKAKTNCASLIAEDLGPGKKAGRWTTWCCPFHKDHHPSLAATETGWKCFACGESGDCIGWLTKYRGLSNYDAIRTLGGEEVYKKHPRYVPAPAQPPSLAEPPSAEWQERCLRVVDEAATTLWDSERALRYLRVQRGLADDTIREARLGYVPGKPSDWRFVDMLAIPCGITIPRFVDGQLWGVNVRRAGGEHKYQQIGTVKRYQEQIGRGNCSEAMYWSDNVRPGEPMLICEGEFDCLVAWQEAGDLLCPVTTGAATNGLNARWFAHLACARQILACFDADKAGAKGAARLEKLGGRIELIRPPAGKDITDYHLTGSGQVRTWLSGLLKPQLQAAPATVPAQDQMLIATAEALALAPVATDQRELPLPTRSELTRPTEPCPTCGNTWWIRSVLGWRCAVCPPKVILFGGNNGQL